MNHSLEPTADAPVSANPYPMRSRPQIAIPAKRPTASVSLAEDEIPTPPPPIVKTSAERDPNFTGVELPSSFYFYPFKEISLGSVRVKHQAKFARAAKDRSTRLTVETISSLMGDDLSAMDLTIPDFFWVMYWLRINNFSKTALTHKAVCNDPQHLLDVREGRKTRDSLVTVDIINRTTIKETMLDTDKLDAFVLENDLSDFTAGGYRLTAPRMRDTIELEEKWLEKDGFEDVAFIADAAACLERQDTSLPRATLEERVNFVSELSPDALKILDAFRLIAQSYGVEERITTRCKDCNAVIETEISITAFDFL